MIPGPNIAWALSILRYARHEGFDLLHSHGYKGNILFGLIPRKIRKIPMVSTLHGWTSTNGFSKLRLYEWFDAKSLKFIDTVALVSNAMKSHPKLKGLKGINFHIIPNGIPISKPQLNDSTINQFNQPTTQFDQSTNQPFNQHNQSPIQFNNLKNQQFDKEILDFCSKGYTIGTIGRLSIEKGHTYLIEAVEILIKDRIDAKLVIIGAGGEKRNLEIMIKKLGLGENILLPGYRGDAKRYIPFFDVFVISSLTEGLPITILEAMLAKVPIVATKVGGIPLALEDGRSGILVPAEDAQALAAAILQIYRDKKKREALVRAAFYNLINNYSSNHMALNYLNVYEKLLGS
jgi:glycosyltransferase involved in cell wall biosynthesis